MGRNSSGYHPVLLLLGLHGVSVTWWNNGATLVGQMGDERIGPVKSRSVHTNARRGANSPLALRGGEIRSREWGCQ